MLAFWRDDGIRNKLQNFGMPSSIEIIWFGYPERTRSNRTLIGKTAFYGDFDSLKRFSE